MRCPRELAAQCRVAWKAIAAAGLPLSAMQECGGSGSRAGGRLVVVPSATTMCDECGSATSPITRDAVTPQGVTAAWWPLRCKFGSAGAGAESPLSRLQFARSRLAPRASGWLDPAVDPDPRPSAEMRVVARTRDATPTTTGDLHRCLRRYGPCLAPDGSPSSGAGSSVFGSDVAASAVSAVARGAATPSRLGRPGAESAVQLLA